MYIMENEKNNTENLTHLMSIFDTICANMKKAHKTIFEKEVQKLVPTEKSEVYLPCGTAESAITFGVYVSNPKPVIDNEILSLDKIIRAWLLLANFDQINNILACLKLKNIDGQGIYDLDFIKIQYNDLIDQYTTNVRIIKVA